MELIAFSTNIINNIYALVHCRSVERECERARKETERNGKMRNIPIFLLKSFWLVLGIFRPYRQQCYESNARNEKLLVL